MLPVVMLLGAILAVLIDISFKMSGDRSHTDYSWLSAAERRIKQQKKAEKQAKSRFWSWWYKPYR